MASSSGDSVLALAIKLQAQFDEEIDLSYKKQTKKKGISLLDSEDDDGKYDSTKENLDFEYAKRLQNELNCDISVPKSNSTFQFQNKKVISLLDSDDEDEDEGDKYYSAKENLDFEYAKRLQNELNSGISVSKANLELQTVKNIVDDQWELIDPNPDVHSLFLTFDKEYFYGSLKGVEVRWSPKMTLCAGLCCYEGRGGLCSIRLSTPLLKLRPRRDLVQTLLHEMIHAYLFVTGNNRDHDAHGSEFHKHMNRINAATGAKITVYHTFHDEVNLYKVHWWRCNGPCRERKPYFGYVKRSMNRPPQPADLWWKDHQATCGGTYTKIKEPDPIVKKRKTVSDSKSIKKGKHSHSIDKSKPSTSKDIRSFFDEKKNLSQNVSNVHTLSDGSNNTSVMQKNESPSVKKSGNSVKGGFTKMNSSNTVTVTNFKNGNNFKKAETNPPCNTSSNVFTINSFSTNSPEKKPFFSFSGQGRSLGSS